MTPTAQSTVVMQLSTQMQRRILAELYDVLRAAPLVRPHTPSGQPMRVRVSAAGDLGWVGDGGAYRYAPAQRDGRPWPPMPESWAVVANEAAGRAYPWDSAIINWYEPDAALGWHRDLAEANRTLPIVTISLGDTASWAIKENEMDKPTRCRLESGAVTLLSGETRLYLHTIERVIPNPLFSPLQQRGRYSITIRVAGPSGGQRG